MFAIWRHRETGRRYLVVERDGIVSVAAGPLDRHDDPRRILETHGNQEHNARALLEIRRHPEQYLREYSTDRTGRAVPVADGDAIPADSCSPLRARNRPLTVEDVYRQLRLGDPIGDR